MDAKKSPPIRPDPGGPKITDSHSPLDGILEDPPAADDALASGDKALWDRTRDKQPPIRQDKKGV